uniref:Dysferlin n=1 Tax=Cacopsylla melanoneura TaxID=428564 RepID=A0A8D8PMH7_9HEMI
MGEYGQPDEDAQQTNNEAMIYKIPQTLLPSMQTYTMEVLFWGLRDVQKIRSPSIAIRCGDGKLNSSVIRDYKRFENFDTISGRVQVNLHKHKIPLVIKLYKRKRGENVYKGILHSFP